MRGTLIKKILVLALGPIMSLLTLFLYIPGPEYYAAAQFDLSDTGVSYRDACQNYMSAGLQQGNSFKSYLTPLHSVSSLRLCTCVSDQVATSWPEGIDLASLIFTEQLEWWDSELESERINAVIAFGAARGISEDDMERLITVNVGAMRFCNKVARQ